MDRNQVLGFFLIGLVFVGYLVYNQPSEAQLKQQQFTRDSIAALQQQQDTLKAPKSLAVAKFDSLRVVTQDTLLGSNDSLKNQKEREMYGVFAPATHGDIKPAILENEHIRWTFSSRGGVPNSAILKEYKTYSQEPLELLNPDQTNFNLQFFLPTTYYQHQRVVF
jgi:YidC/Oxa1 family membrane protein insertase